MGSRCAAMQGRAAGFRAGSRWLWVGLVPHATVRADTGLLFGVALQARYTVAAPAGRRLAAILIHIVANMVLADVLVQGSNVAAQSGIGLGSAIAVVCSWQRNRSILWAILAGILSWFYVIYFALTRRSDEMNRLLEAHRFTCLMPCTLCL